MNNLFFFDNSAKSNGKTWFLQKSQAAVHNPLVYEQPARIYEQPAGVYEQPAGAYEQPSFIGSLGDPEFLNNV